MATATIVSGTQPTTIDNAEAVTNWGGDTFALNSTAGIEGSNCVECAQTTNGNNDAYVTGTWDFSGGGSGDQHLRLWFNFTYFENFAATNPIQIFLYDGSNTAYYYWDKGGSYQGGWSQAVIYTGDTPDSGTVTKSSITRIGIRVVTASKPRNVPFNALFDAWKYGDGYTVTGGTSGDPITWADIAATDLTSAYGIVFDNEGVYNLRGDIQIGNGIATTYFEPSGELAVFTTEQINSGLYGISFVDDSSALTNINIAGGAISGPGTALTRFTFDASEPLINSFTIDGLQLSSSSTVDFHAGASITNTSFSDCYQIDPSTATFENNTIANYSETTTNGALLWPGGTTVKNCSFLNCDEGVEIAQTTNQTFDNLQFDDISGKFDVHLNNGGTDIDVAKNNGTNANSYTSSSPTGVVTFTTAAVTALIRVIDENRAPYFGARTIFKASDGTGDLPYQDVVTITRSGDTATVTHTAHGLATGKKVEIKGASQYDYNGVKTVTVTTANAYTFTMDSPYPTSPATGDLTLLTDAQDETSYANSPTTEGVFTGGTGFAVSDTIQLNKGITVTVDAIDSPGVVTQFTVNAGSQQTDPIYKDETLFQTGGSRGTFGIIQSGYNNASGSATSITVSPTLTAGTGRKLLVWGGNFHGADTTITATYDGNSMTSINNVLISIVNDEQELLWYDIPDGDSGSRTLSSRSVLPVPTEASCLRLLAELQQAQRKPRQLRRGLQ